MRKIDERDIEEFGTLDSSENTIAVLADRWWPQTAKQKEDKIITKNFVNYMKEHLSAHVLEVSLLGRGTVLHLETGA